MRKFVFALAVLALWTDAAFAQRLPVTVTPTHYTLWFAPDLQKATFRGRETIEVTVPNPTTSVTLNAAEMEWPEFETMFRKLHTLGPDDELPPVHEMIRLDPANSAYDPQFFRPDEVEVQGKLAGLLRRYH